VDKNLVKEKLRKGKVCIGVWHEIGHPDIAEIQAMTGWDFMLYDTEHSPIELTQVQSCIQVAARFATTPLIRVAWNDPVLIKKALDIGAHGLLIPWVNSEAEAQRAVESCRYPLEGIRGFGPRRASMYGTNTDDYFERFAKEEILLIVQIETQRALENIDGILSVEGVDVAFVGPMDLSISLGIRQQFDNPQFKEAVQLVLRKCKEYHVIPAMDGGGTAERTKQRIDMGFRLLPLASDVDFLVEAEQTAYQSIKDLIS